MASAVSGHIRRFIFFVSSFRKNKMWHTQISNQKYAVQVLISQTRADSWLIESMSCLFVCPTILSGRHSKHR